MRNLQFSRGITILASAIILAGFGPQALAQKKKKQESTVPQVTKVTVNFPSLTTLGDTSPSQVKGGIAIAVAPVEYKLQPAYESRVRRVAPGFKESLMMAHEQNDAFVERTCIPALKVTPDRMRFQVTLSNQMPRVFHGAGLVVQFNIAGKLISTDEKGYSELANAIIPPRSQQQFEIYGPELNTLPQQGAVSLFFYDVVTDVDAAGNVSGKQNFEWDFQFTSQLKEQEMEIPPPDRMWVGPGRGIGACVVGASLTQQ